MLTPKLKKLFWLTISIGSIAGLIFSGSYIYKQKSQRDYKNQILSSQNKMVEAVRKGDVVIDQEIHHWQIKEIEGKSHNPLEIELFVHNKSSNLINGNLVFTVEVNYKHEFGQS